MPAYNTVAELEALMKAATSSLILPSKEEDDTWKAQYLCQPRATPAMDLVPGSRDWIKQAQEKMAQSGAVRARALEHEREAIRAAAAYQQAQADRAREDEEKAAAEERRRRQVEEEAQRTDWDIL